MAIEIVGKIGSMAMIRKEENDIDYNIISQGRFGAAPGHDLRDQRRGGDWPGGLHEARRT